MFDHQREFFDINVVNETRNQTYGRLAKLAGIIGIDERAMLELLTVSEKPSSDGQLNTGNKVTNDIKLMVKVGSPQIIHYFSQAA